MDYTPVRQYYHVKHVNELKKGRLSSISKEDEEEEESITLRL